MKKNEDKTYLNIQKSLKNLGFEINLTSLDHKSLETLFKLCQEHEQLKLAKEIVLEQDSKISPFMDETETNNDFKAIVEQSFECVSIANLEGHYVYANDAFCDLMGYTKEEVLSMTVFDMKENPAETDIFRAAKNGSTVGEILLKERMVPISFVASEVNLLK